MRSMLQLRPRCQLECGPHCVHVRLSAFCRYWWVENMAITRVLKNMPEQGQFLPLGRAKPPLKLDGRPDLLRH